MCMYKDNNKLAVLAKPSTLYVFASLAAEVWGGDDVRAT